MLITVVYALTRNPRLALGDVEGWLKGGSGWGSEFGALERFCVGNLHWGESGRWWICVAGGEVEG